MQSEVGPPSRFLKDDKSLLIIIFQLPVTHVHLVPPANMVPLRLIVVEGENLLP